MPGTIWCWESSSGQKNKNRCCQGAGITVDSRTMDIFSIFQKVHNDNVPCFHNKKEFLISTFSTIKVLIPVVRLTILRAKYFH